MRNLTLLFGAVLLVHGVFGACEQKSVFVMVGDSVTLNADLTKIKDFEELQWKIEGENRIIAVIDRENDVNDVPGNNKERFGDRLKLDDQTGFLTITNIRTTDSNVYELTTKNSRDEDTCTFSVTVRGNTKTIPVKEGDPVNLLTGLFDIQGRDLILWKFKDHLIAEMDKRTDKSLIHDISHELFNDRMQLNDKTGSLFISDSRSTDYGVYHLQMISSSYTIQRNISVAVIDSRNSGAGSGISGASVALMVWAVTVFLLQV